MKHYIAIYDEDTEYAAKLANYMKLSDIFPFVSRLCFSKEELIEVCDSCTPQIVLLSDNNCYKAEDILIGEKIYLSTEKSGSDDGKNLIFKYQSGEKIIKEILRITANSKQIGAIVSRKSTLKVYSYFTPVKRSLSTTMSIAMGQMLSKKNKTLYINFECFSGLQSLLGRAITKNIGDLLYFMESHEEGFGTALAGIVENSEGLDILPSFNNQSDLIGVEEKTWLKLVEYIERYTDYEYLLLDLSDAVQGLFELLGISDKVITSVDNDEVAIFKLMQYEEALKLAGYEEVLEKTKKCNVPHQHRKNGEISFLGYGEMGSYVKTILQGLVDDERLR